MGMNSIKRPGMGSLLDAVIEASKDALVDKLDGKKGAVVKIGLGVAVLAGAPFAAGAAVATGGVLTALNLALGIAVAPAAIIGANLFLSGRISEIQYKGIDGVLSSSDSAVGLTLSAFARGLGMKGDDLKPIHSIGKFSGTLLEPGRAITPGKLLQAYSLAKGLTLLDLSEELRAKQQLDAEIRKLNTQKTIPKPGKDYDHDGAPRGGKGSGRGLGVQSSPDTIGGSHGSSGAVFDGARAPKGGYKY